MQSLWYVELSIRCNSAIHFPLKNRGIQPAYVCFTAGLWRSGITFIQNQNKKNLNSAMALPLQVDSYCSYCYCGQHTHSSRPKDELFMVSFSTVSVRRTLWIPSRYLEIIYDPRSGVWRTSVIQPSSHSFTPSIATTSSTTILLICYNQTHSTSICVLSI